MVAIYLLGKVLLPQDLLYTTKSMVNWNGLNKSQRQAKRKQQLERFDDVISVHKSSGKRLQHAINKWFYRFMVAKDIRARHTKADVSDKQSNPERNATN